MFDNEVEPAWRAEAFALIRECSNLTFLMLTKRIGNVLAMIEQAADYHFDHGDRNVAGWLTDWYKHGVPPANVWLGATVVTQEEASRDVPKLLAVPARVRFLSCEPLLERIVLRPDVLPYETDNNGPIYRGIDWLIIGGESGACARPFVIGWGKELVAQCRAAGVPVFFKQLGSNATNRSGVRHVTKDGKGGDQQEWPTELRVQQFPEVA